VNSINSASGVGTAQKSPLPQCPANLVNER
jgi:hypothetical protein